MEYESYLMHHGVKGQKWGTRRYRNYDGTRTAAGRAQRRAEYRGEKKSSSGGRKSSSGSSSLSSGGTKTKKGMSAKTKSRLKTAAKVAGAAALIGASAYALKKTGAGSQLATVAKNAASKASSSNAGKAVKNAAGSARKKLTSAASKAKNSSAGKKVSTIASKAGKSVKDKTKDISKRASNGRAAIKRTAIRVDNARKGVTDGTKTSKAAAAVFDKTKQAKNTLGGAASKVRDNASKLGGNVKEKATGALDVGKTKAISVANKAKNSKAGKSAKSAAAKARKKIGSAKDKFNNSNAGAKLRGAKVSAGVRAGEARDALKKVPGAVKNAPSTLKDKARGARLEGATKGAVLKKQAQNKVQAAKDKFNNSNAGAKLRGAKVSAGVRAGEARDALKKVPGAVKNAPSTLKDKARGARLEGATKGAVLKKQAQNKVQAAKDKFNNSNAGAKLRGAKVSAGVRAGEARDALKKVPGAVKNAPSTLKDKARGARLEGATKGAVLKKQAQNKVQAAKDKFNNSNAGAKLRGAKVSAGVRAGEARDALKKVPGAVKNAPSTLKDKARGARLEGATKGAVLKKQAQNKVQAAKDKFNNSNAGAKLRGAKVSAGVRAGEARDALKKVPGAVKNAPSTLKDKARGARLEGATKGAVLKKQAQNKVQAAKDKFNNSNAGAKLRGAKVSAGVRAGEARDALKKVPGAVKNAPSTLKDKARGARLEGATKGAVLKKQAQNKVQAAKDKFNNSNAGAKLRGAKVSAGVRAGEARDALKKVPGAVKNAPSTLKDKARGARLEGATKGAVLKKQAQNKVQAAKDKFNNSNAGAKLRGAKVSAGVRAGEARDALKKVPGAVKNAPSTLKDKARGARLEGATKGAVLKKQAQNKVQAAKDKFNNSNVKARLSGAAKTVKEKASGGASSARDRLSGAAKTVKEKASGGASSARDRLSGAAKTVKEKASGGASSARDRLSGAAKIVKEKASGGASSARDRLSGAAKTVKEKTNKTISQTKAKIGINKQNAEARKKLKQATKERLDIKNNPVKPRKESDTFKPDTLKVGSSATDRLKESATRAKSSGVKNPLETLEDIDRYYTGGKSSKLDKKLQEDAKKETKKLEDDDYILKL